MNRHVSTGVAPDAVAAIAVSVTVVTSTRPATLTKHFRLEGKDLIKSPGGQLVRGRAEVREVIGLKGLGDLLLSLTPSEALIYGLPKNSPADLTTKDLWQAAGGPADRMPRTADMFYWSTALGILMLDYDPEPGTKALSRDDLVATIRQAVPGLRDAQFLWWPSASSHIFDARTNKDLTGLRGQRLYLLVKDARDIPRAGKAIVDKLWLGGHGFVKVSNSGQLLMRTVVDASVWQTNRFDFAAGASCAAPLEQRRGEPMLIPGTCEIVDTKSALPELSHDDEAKAEAARAKARSAMQSNAQKARADWIERRVQELLHPDADQTEQNAARATARSAVEHSLLTGDYRIVVLENGAEITVTVSKVLSDPARFDGLQTLDPLEPDYKARRAVGMLFLLGRTCCLFSFAHGGTAYRLLKQLDEVEIKKGKRREAVDATLDILRSAPNVFDLGDALVVVQDGRLWSLDEAALGYDLGGRLQYWRWQTPPRGAPYKVLEDPPQQLLKTILSLKKQRGLKQLTAVITAPTLRSDGSVLDEPGYDAETGLYLDPPGPLDININLSPCAREVDAALDVLLAPFRDFPFVDQNDCGVMLAALLTAVVRPTLPTCPAFGFDAPVQGSGKTLLAECIAWLATGSQPRLYAHTGGRGDDDEVRKRIFSALLEGQGAIIWDNVIGTFDSAAMAAAITSENYTDRVLGKSETLSVPNRQLRLLTGNNLTLAGDMSRRVLKCRIDPRTDQPFAREFDFDPKAHVRENRLPMVAAAITVMRGWLSSEAPRASGRMASFEAWDDIVRQTVVWAGTVISAGEFGDPLSVVVAAQQDDPELELLAEMLKAWACLFGDRLVSTADVIRATSGLAQLRLTGGQSAGVSLAEAIKAISEHAVQSPISLGKVLKYRVDRVAGGRRLEMRTDPHFKTKLWRVVSLDEVSNANKVSGDLRN